MEQLKSRLLCASCFVLRARYVSCIVDVLLARGRRNDQRASRSRLLQKLLDFRRA